MLPGPNVPVPAYPTLVGTLPRPAAPRPATPAEARALAGLLPDLLLPPPPLRRYEVTVTVTRGPGEPPAALPSGVDGIWCAEKTLYWAVTDAVDQGGAVRGVLEALGDAAGWDAEVSVRALG